MISRSSHGTHRHRLGEQLERRELGTQRVRRRELNAVNAERGRGVGVGRHVVDEDSAMRLDRVGIEQRVKIRGSGLVALTSPDTTTPRSHRRNSKRAKAGGHGLDREIGQPVEGRAALAQLGEDRHRAGDRARHHFVEPFARGPRALSCGYPLTDPRVNPWITKRCPKNIKRTAGIVATIEAAAIWPC